MAATTKTLTPTNQVISIPAFTDKPDNRLQIDSTGKLADAVNALDEQIAKRALVFCPTGTGTTNNVGQMDINTGITLSGKRVMALSNYASGLAMQYGVYTETWTSNGTVTCRVRRLSDGVVVANTNFSLDNIMLIIF